MTHEFIPLNKCNARFWMWHNDDWVKVTLIPGQKVLIFGGRMTDEGYHSWSETLEHCGDYVLSRQDSYGCDCDGPYQSNSDYICPLENLHSSIPGGDDNPHEVLNDGTPSWVRSSSSQRDYFAESMGY